MRYPHPPSDVRAAKTLGEAAQNPDGTYNAAKAMSWLSAAVSKTGKGLSEDEVQGIIAEAMEKRRVRAPSTGR